jgi:hypothetical protein
MAIQLGQEVRDTISGFEGVVIAVTNWLYGCRRITVQPRDMKDGKPIESCTFDEPQLLAMTDTAAAERVPTGGDRDTPPRAADPR